MLVQELLEILDSNPDSSLFIELPSGELVPYHFHVTEVGRVHKQFVDCGGVQRETLSCMLQIWTADDREHRLTSKKLRKIMDLSLPILGSTDLQLGVEYGQNVAAQYMVDQIEKSSGGLLFRLVGKQTECLAPSRCGLSIVKCC